MYDKYIKDKVITCILSKLSIPRNAHQCIKTVSLIDDRIRITVLVLLTCQKQPKLDIRYRKLVTIIVRLQLCMVKKVEQEVCYSVIERNNLIYPRKKLHIALEVVLENLGGKTAQSPATNCIE